MPVCRLCGRDFTMITNSHLQSQHGISSVRYEYMFPGTRMEDSILGEQRSKDQKRSWTELSPEGKKERLGASIHSVVSRESAKKVKSRSMLGIWASYSLKERRERLKQSTQNETARGRQREVMDTLQGENSPRWRGGPQTYGWGWRDIGYFVLVRDHFTCQKCGSRENLCPHHIDYNVENMEDTNLITLCRGCNIRVNSNRTYWMDIFKRKIAEILDLQENKREVEIR